MTMREFRRQHSLPARWRPKNLWNVVRRLIRENYDMLIKEDIRNGYYIVGDLLADLIGKEIEQPEYDWIITDQGYSSYRDDIWVGLEQNEQLKRPEARPDGWYFIHGLKKPIEEMESVWGQIRGWIFVEKSKEAEKLKDLSRNGWAIVVAGKGFPSRLIRRLLKEEDKPVLIFHDSDKTGSMIYDVFGEGSRRTKHLDLLIEKATDIGLDWDDVVKLELPTRPEPPKYKGEPRAEISALVVLKLRMGIENPTLEYIKIKMLQENITIAPLDISKLDLWKSETKFTVEKIIDRGVKEYVEDAINSYEIEDGDAVYATFDGNGNTEYIDVSMFEDFITELVKKLYKKLDWVYASEIHAENVKGINRDFATKMGIDLNSGSE